MRKNILGYTAIFFASFLFLTNLSAQDYVGKSRNFSLSEDDLMILAPEAFDTEDPQKAASMLFNWSPQEILNKAKAGGIEPQITESTFYISGKNFRADTNEPEEGKMSVIIKPEEDLMCMINWARNEVVRMSIKEMGQKVDQSKKMMESHMANLPEEARQAMKQYMGTPDTGEKLELKNTGKSGNFNNFECREYRLEAGQKTTQLWVTTQYPDIRKSFEFFMKNMPVGMDDENDPDLLVIEQIPGAWTVISKDFTFNMMRGQIDLEVEEMLSMVKSTVKPGIYDIPSHLTEKSMDDVMDVPELKR